TPSRINRAPSHAESAYRFAKSIPSLPTPHRSIDHHPSNRSPRPTNSTPAFVPEGGEQGARQPPAKNPRLGARLLPPQSCRCSRGRQGGARRQPRDDRRKGDAVPLPAPLRRETPAATAP